MKASLVNLAYILWHCQNVPVDGAELKVEDISD
jgi:hypothetical protein